MRLVGCDLAELAADRQVVRAVLIVDMCGFSRLTAEAGILSALAAIAALQDAAERAVAVHGGRVVKFWADNVMATFLTVAEAQAAAGDIVAGHPASAGIGFGPMLDLGGDLFGDEVNKASRLGEDVAGRGEVLLTEAAQLSESEWDGDDA